MVSRFLNAILPLARFGLATFCEEISYPIVLGGDEDETLVNCVVFPKRNINKIVAFGVTNQSFEHKFSLQD